MNHPLATLFDQFLKERTLSQERHPRYAHLVSGRVQELPAPRFA